MKNDLVVQHNALIEAKYSYTTLEAKLIYSFVSLVEKDDSEFWTYTIPAKDIGDYKEIKKSCRTILTKPIVIEKEQKKDWLMFNWFSSIEYKDGYLEASFSPKLKPYLLGLQKYVTKFGLSNILKLDSRYGIRLYTILKKEQFKKVFLIDFKELCELLQVPKTYKVFKGFKQKVLDIGLEDINNRTDIKVEYSLIKKGRAVTAIKFNILDASIETLIKNTREKYKGKDTVLLTTNDNVDFKINANGHVELGGELLTKESAMKFWKILYDKECQSKTI